MFNDFFNFPCTFPRPHLPARPPSPPPTSLPPPCSGSGLAWEALLSAVPAERVMEGLARLPRLQRVTFVVQTQVRVRGEGAGGHAGAVLDDESSSVGRVKVIVHRKCLRALHCYNPTVCSRRRSERRWRALKCRISCLAYRGSARI